jgi:hypothetical protein
VHISAIRQLPTASVLKVSEGNGQKYTSGNLLSLKRHMRLLYLDCIPRFPVIKENKPMKIKAINVIIKICLPTGGRVTLVIIPQICIWELTHIIIHVPG